MGVVVASIGFVLVLLGAIILFTVLRVGAYRRADPTYAHMTDDTTPIDRARSGPVALRGTAAPVGGAVLTEPLTGATTLWYRLEIDGGFRSGADHWRWDRIHSEGESVDFDLEDGSTESARVDSDHTSYVAWLHRYGPPVVLASAGELPWVPHDLDDDHEAALRRLAAQDPPYVRGDLRTLTPGETVTVVGWLDRGLHGPTVVGRPPEHPLIVYAVDPATLRRDKHERARNRKVLALVSIGMIVGGLLLVLAGLG